MTKHDPNRAENIVAIIRDYEAEYGYAPSVREIGERVGLSSTSAVHHYLVKLRKAGVIEDGHGRARALTFREDAPRLTTDRLDLAWCLSVHGSKPPRKRPCSRHRLVAQWLVEFVIPRAMALP